MPFCLHCKKHVGQFGCFLAICPIKHVVKDIQPITGPEKVKQLVDNGTITLEDIVNYINNYSNSTYQVIDLW